MDQESSNTQSIDLRPGTIEAEIGTCIGTTPWQRIDKLAEDILASLVGDYDAMHNIDAGDWAKAVNLDDPIVIGTHGLSLIPWALAQAGIPTASTDSHIWRPVSLGRVRFPSPLLVGSQFRIHSVLDNVRHLDRVTEIVTSHEGEIERGESPWFVASDLVSNIIVKEAFAL